MNWKTLLCSLLIATTGWASEFTDANALYHDNRFAEAAAAYEKTEPKTAAVYFNLGNAYYRQEKLGLALLNYERARRLAPRDPDIQANLRFAEQRLGVAESNAAQKPVQRFLRDAAFSRSLGEWNSYEVTGLWALVLFVAGTVWWPRLRTGFVILSVAAGLWWAGASVGLAYRVVTERNAPVAIVLVGKTEARFAPQADGTVHFQLPEGTKVCVREDRGAWWFVERADGQQGWVMASALACVQPR